MQNESAKAKTIVLGVSGGVAAYKAAELVRLLSERGLIVQVVMTAGARRFVQPLTFAALTGRKVITKLFSEADDESTFQSSIEHIAVAQAADVLLVAPATADVLAKFAHGIADDFLTTMQLAYTGPMIVAPAMNVNMLSHAATQSNMRVLQSRGVRVVEPEDGALACGMVGPGRLAELSSIVTAVEEALASTAPQAPDLDGETVLITAGPTKEHLDPVRFLSNHSSGRMGYALAEEARVRGARVIFVRGPVELAPPQDCELVAVTTAEQMHQAVLERLRDATIVIAAAAVADYRPRRAAVEKIKKQSGSLALELEPTPDILAEVGRLKGERVVIGFAAETEDVAENARKKLAAKNCDLIVANPVGAAAGGTGFDSDQNQGWLIDATGGAVELPPMSKRQMAATIFDHALAYRRQSSYPATRYPSKITAPVGPLHQVGQS